MKKRITAGIIIFLAGLIISVVQNVAKFNDFVENKGPAHYFGDTAEYITDLNGPQQELLLSAFDVKIPDSEPEAYIRFFGKKEFSGKYTAYFIEFDDVDNPENFYSANAHREPSINETTGVKDDILLVYAVRVTPAEHEEQIIAHLYDEFS